MGDAKLFAACGSWLGISSLPLVLLIASASALLYVGVRVWHGDMLAVRARFAFGPFLALGFWTLWIMSL